MIYQENGIFRFLIIYFAGSIVIAVFLILAFKLIRRYKSDLTVVLSSFYVIGAFGLILNLIYFPIRIPLIVYILYFITLFSVLYCQIFLVIFNILLYKKDMDYSIKKILLIALIYGILLIVAISIPGGFMINRRTNWSPLFTWWFLFTLYLIMTFCTILPFNYYLFKLHLIFQDITIKKKLRLWLIGFWGFAILMYGTLLMNTWQNEVYRFTWSIIYFPLAMCSAIIMYRAWNRPI